MFDHAARLALSPILLAQALRIRRRAQSLPEAAGPRTGQQGRGPLLRLHIIGDSSAAGVGARTQTDALAGQLAQRLGANFTCRWSLDATTGATTRSTLARLHTAPPAPCDIVITALGVNDITRLVRPKVWLALQNRLLARIQTLYAPRHIYLSGVPPLEHFPLLPDPLRWTLARQGRAFDTAMTAHAATQGDITYLPADYDLDPALMASDGFHPSEKLYAIWAEKTASRIVTDWPHLSRE